MHFKFYTYYLLKASCMSSLGIHLLKILFIQFSQKVMVGHEVRIQTILDSNPSLLTKLIMTAGKLLSLSNSLSFTTYYKIKVIQFSSMSCEN